MSETFELRRVRGTWVVVDTRRMLRLAAQKNSQAAVTLPHPPTI
jgi:hypothetical protein